ncbi:hypothetical protein MY5147_007574 [Beauveria neobassiana]
MKKDSLQMRPAHGQHMRASGGDTTKTPRYAKHSFGMDKKLREPCRTSFESLLPQIT